jgi:hypothetical protein
MQRWSCGRQSLGVQRGGLFNLLQQMLIAIRPAVISKCGPKHGEDIKQLALFRSDGILACGSASLCSRLQFEPEIAHLEGPRHRFRSHQVTTHVLVPGAMWRVDWPEPILLENDYRQG